MAANVQCDPGDGVDLERLGNIWMRTASGKRVYPFATDGREAQGFCLEDVATHLANLCRFGGAVPCEKWISVAQHSVLVSCIVPPEMQLAGLLHDAAEGYIGDRVRPLKGTLAVELPDACLPFREFEHIMLERIFRQINAGLPEGAKVIGRYVLSEDMAQADDIALATEVRDILGIDPAELGLPQSPLRRIRPLDPVVARGMFLERYRELTDRAFQGQTFSIRRMLHDDDVTKGIER